MATKYHIRGGELDRAYLGAACLIVIEVRYRSRNDFGRGAETVTPAMQGRITRATQLLLLETSDDSFEELSRGF